MQTRFGPVLTTADVSLVGAVALAAGERHSLALMRDGRVLAWGANEDGQLGDGSRRASATPVHVRAAGGGAGQLRDVTAIAADSNTSMALRKDGTVVVWGRSNSGQRGDFGTTADPLVPSVTLAPGGTGPLTGVRQISADGGSELALTDTKHIIGWGDNTFGQLGPGAPHVAWLPVTIQGGDGRPLANVQDIAIGGQHSVALLEDGRVLAWGGNDANQLGDGKNESRKTPELVMTAPDKPLTNVREVSSAEKHTLALLRDGSVVGWGANSRGQLGDGTRIARDFAVPVLGPGKVDRLTHVSEVVAGETYSIALMQNGKVYTWGSNGRGQLANGQREDRIRPGAVAVEQGVPAPESVIAVGAGRRHLLIALL